MKKMKLEEYENLFRQNKWEKYLPNLYQWTIDEKPIGELIECIEKMEGSKKDSNNSKPSPILRYKGADISYNKQTNEFKVKTPEPTKVGVSCPSGEQGYLEDDNAGCRVIGSPIANLLKKENPKERK